jgi:hypothetical protein
MLKSLGLWKTVDDVIRLPPELISATESSYSSGQQSETHKKSDTQVVDNCEYFPGIIPLT